MKNEIKEVHRVSLPLSEKKEQLLRQAQHIRNTNIKLTTTEER